MQATKLEPAPTLGQSLLNLIRQHPLIAFFLIAYAFTWTYDLLFLILFPLPDFPMRASARDLGPSIAALVVTGVLSGRPGIKALLRRFLIWRVKPVWYFFVVLGVPAIFVVGILLVPGAIASFKAPSLVDVLLYPVMFVYIVVFAGPLFEEPGWRGFALPRLQQRWGPLSAAVILGLLWGAWHFTEYLTPDFSRANGGFTLSGVGVFVVAAVCFSIVITWVFNNTQASILIAILLHAFINFTQLATSFLFPAAAFNEVVPVTVFALVTVVIVLMTRGRLGYEAPGAVGSTS